MCGICGFIDYSSSSNIEILQRMTDLLYHRGPDQSGCHYDENGNHILGMGHRRLSILDLSEYGKQPMTSQNGRFIIVYNGEIYNFRDLREELSKNAKFIFSSDSDTEVLVDALEYWGVEKTLKKLVGMFAFAAWDLKERCMYLARDRMGEKPLYYGWQNDTFFFASDLKSFSVHPATKKEIDKRAVSSFLRYGYVPGPLSIYKGIFKLDPGSYLTLQTGEKTGDCKKKIQKYWDLHSVFKSGVEKPLNVSEEDAISQLDSLLSESLRGQLISDVPLGAFLSGGVDSSLVVAIMQKMNSQPVKTFTVGFHEDKYNEAPYAKAVADHLHTEHTELYISEKDALDLVPDLPSIYSEPFADSSQIPTCLISELTRKHVTVSLSGDGGDELFLGYKRYQNIKNRWSWFNKIPLKKCISKLLGSKSFNASMRIIERFDSRLATFSRAANRFGPLSNCSNIEDFYDYSNSIISPMHQFVDRDMCQHQRYDYGFSFIENIEHYFAAVDMSMYLPDDILVKVDRAAMNFSLETRVPLLDHRIVEFSARLPYAMKCLNQQPKGLLRHLLYRYVPSELIERPKQGFAVPMSKWLRTDLRDWAEELLTPKSLRDSNVGLNDKTIVDLFNRHKAGRNDFSPILWNILMLQAWIGLSNGS